VQQNGGKISVIIVLVIISYVIFSAGRRV